ncbi:MAG TPA: glycoside hydrolase family 13 protein [Chitinophagaceae bacterium]|jgi:glycosidase|nr:glycoside hydrolase family 13 protein [Chitinophagaceae bacterium]HMU56627.1 glycoside hydrolase family 13 protein [Chitinophagaceae bacterium]
MSGLRNLYTVLLSFALTSAFAQPLRIEPTNWWVGMKNPALQLMVNSVGIGDAVPFINHPGVVIKKVHKADSPNYLFIDLVIAKNTKPGMFNIIFKRSGEITSQVQYELKQRKTDAARLKGFSSSDVIYLITPDRFANGDSTNDIRTEMREKKLNRKNDYGRHGGDIRGIINNLDYIRNMGFTAIWPTPMLENDMRESSYHGYAITDYYKVDPRFGTIDEYKELAEKCSQKGLKLVFDGVVNHTGSNYWWMKDLPFKNWINYADSMRITNHRRTVNQDLYAAASDKELMVKGWFVSSMPDMNQSNPFLAEFLIQNTIWWAETLSLGGIRQDTYPYSEKKFLEQWTCRILNEYPQFSIVGEEWSINPLIAAYWQKGKPNTTGYNGCMKNTMDFPMQAALVAALTEPEGWDKGIVKLYEGLANDFVYANPDDLLVFGDNHDMNRLFTFLNNDVDLMQMALSYILTIRGIPQVYYGTEVLMHNSAKPGDHGLIRSDFPGGWTGDTANAFTGENLSADQQRIQIFLKKLLNWRKVKTVIHQGKTLHFAPQNGTYAYFRYNDKEAVMVVMNKNSNAVSINTKRFSEIIKERKQGINILTGEKLSIDREITIPAKSALILEIQ